MRLPDYVNLCIQALEDAGYTAYAVGGCVRDQLLGLIPADFDLCSSALPEQIRQVFSGRGMVLSGLKHGTVGIIFPEGVVEITTYRKEGDYSDNRHPDWVSFVDDIEEDLARRDYTINAMAWSPIRGWKDPFGGREDMNRGILRAVGEPAQRFREDALRILRGARFAAKYRLTPHPKTLDAMIRMVPLMDDLARERVFSELCKLLMAADAQDLLRFAPIITRAIPELEPAVGFDQHSRHHAYDLFTHIAHVTAAVPRKLTLRWAALLHDVGKVETYTMDEEGQGHFYGHAVNSGRIANEVLLRLKAPTALREQVVELVELHMTPPVPQKKALRRRLSRMGQENFFALLELQEADMGSKGTGVSDSEEQTHFENLRQMALALLEEESCLTLKELAVNGYDLMQLGIPAGKELGACLQHLLDQVLDEVLPNDKDLLLDAAKALWCARS